MNKRDGKNTKSGTAPRSNKGSSKKGGQTNSTQRAPVAIGNRTFNQNPKTFMKNGRWVVQHSEYFGDILGSTATYLVRETIPINPGLISSFPWLNEIASRYEQYKFRKLNVRFMTERPTTESGYVAIVPDYDAHDVQPVSKTAAFQYQGAAKCAPWENVTQINTPANLNKRKEYFVRQGILPAGADVALYDTGNIYVCVGGNSAQVVLGELWFDYEVEFYTPQLDSLFGTSRSGIIDSQTLTTPALPLGVSPLIKFSRDQLCTYDDTLGLITFLSDYEGLMVMEIVGTGLIGFSTAGSTTTQTAVGSCVNTGATTAIGVWAVKAEKGQYWDPSVNGTTVTSGELRMGGYLRSLG